MSRYEFTETTIAYENFLYYRMDRATIPKHREIIGENGGKLRIVPYTHQFPDGGESICYHIQGFLPIEKVFKRRRLNFEELALLLYGVIHTISNAKVAGLLADSFVLSPRYVYLSPDSIQPFLLYLPTLSDLTLKEEFTTLLDFLENAVDASIPNTTKLVHTLKTITNRDFDMNAIINTVVAAANSNKVAAPKKYLEEPKATPKVSQLPKTGQPQQPQQPPATTRTSQTQQSQQEEQTEQTEQIEQTELIEPIEPIEQTQQTQQSPVNTAPQQMQPAPQSAPKPPPQPAPPRSNKPRNTPPQPQADKRGFFARFFNIGIKKQEDDFLPTIDDRTMIDFTAQDEGEGQPMLYVLEGSSRVAQIEIKGDAFILGRNPTQVDYCFDGEDSKGVSRVHAAIIYDGSNYYANDKGSAGGTFVNDERIPPSGSALIKNGDIIRLYNKRLLFEVL